MQMFVLNQHFSSTPCVQRCPSHNTRDKWHMRDSSSPPIYSSRRGACVRVDPRSEGLLRVGVSDDHNALAAPPSPLSDADTPVCSPFARCIFRRRSAVHSSDAPSFALARLALVFRRSLRAAVARGWCCAFGRSRDGEFGWHHRPNNHRPWTRRLCDASLRARRHACACHSSGMRAGRRLPPHLLLCLPAANGVPAMRQVRRCCALREVRELQGRPPHP